MHQILLCLQQTLLAALWSGVGIARKGTRMEGAKIVMMKDEYEGIKKENWMKEALNRE